MGSIQKVASTLLAALLRLTACTLTAGLSFAFAQVTLESASVSYAVGTNVGGFGQPVCQAGPWLFVVATNHQDIASGNTSRRGVVYVYRRTGGSWHLTQSLISPTQSSLTSFGWWRIAAEGQTLVVGDSNDRTDGVQAGRVHIFEEAGGMWHHRTSLAHPRAAAGNAFGFSVDCDGDRIVVGSIGDPIHEQYGGAAFVFQRDASGTWQLEAELFGQNLLSYPTLAGLYILFGRNVAIEDDVIAITSTRHAGYVTVFERLASGWTERTDLVRWPFHPEGEFGLWGLDVSRDWIAVGSILGPQPIPVDYGRVFMYRRDATYPGGWRPMPSLIASNASTNAWGSDGFGASIQIEGRRMVVGARYARASPSQVVGIGQAYLFEEANGAWNEIRRFSAERIESQAHLMGASAFGDAVSLSGGVVAVGDWADIQANGLGGPGRVYLYEEPLGWTHCPGAGSSPSLSVVGTPHATLGSLTLELRQLGGSTICLLAAANVGGSTPVGPGPGGLPCLVGPARRLGVLTSSLPWGLFEAELDVEVPGLGLLAGETWAFQAWCRVPGGTATSNGVALTFE